MPQTVDRRGDALVRLQPRQRADQRDRVSTGGAAMHAGGGLLQAQLGVIPALPMHDEAHRFAFGVDDDFLDDGAQDPFLDFGRRRGVIPQARHVVGQGKDVLLGLLAQGLRTLAHQLGHLLFEPRLHRQRIIPAPLQRIGHQAVRRVHRVVLTLRAHDLVAGTLEGQAFLAQPFVLDALQAREGT